MVSITRRSIWIAKKWKAAYIDLRVTMHILQDRSMTINGVSISNIRIKTAGSRVVKGRSRGKSEWTPINDKEAVYLNCILKIPEITRNLSSVSSSKIMGHYHPVLLLGIDGVMKMESKIADHGKHENRLYLADLEKKDEKAVTATRVDILVLGIWHRRLAKADCVFIMWIAEKTVVIDVKVLKLPSIEKSAISIQAGINNTQIKSCKYTEMHSRVVVHTDVAEMNEHYYEEQSISWHSLMRNQLSAEL